MKSFIKFLGLTLLVFIGSITCVQAQTPAPAPAGGNAGGSITSTVPDFKKLENPLGGAKIGTINDAIEAVLKIILKISIPFVTLMIIYTGFLFVKAQGNQEKITEARNTLVAVVVGAALLIGSVSLANAIAGTIEKVGKDVSQG